MPNDQKKINRCNRHRGSAFEKTCADLLGMEVVPYSGSNARFGFGDIRDSIWLGECKNISPDDNNKVTIKMDWLTKNLERATNINRLSFLAWMPKGKPNKYIILDGTTYGVLRTIGIDRVGINLDKKHNTKNIIIDMSSTVVTLIKKDIVLVIDNKWYMMTIETFKKLIYASDKKGTVNDDHTNRGNKC